MLGPQMPQTGNTQGLSNLEGIARQIATVLGQINNNVVASTEELTDINDTIAATFPPALTSSVSWNPGAVPPATSVTKTVAVTSSVLGQIVLPALSVSLSGTMLTGYISTAGTATAVLYNPTAATVTISSGTLLVNVLVS